MRTMQFFMLPEPSVAVYVMSYIPIGNRSPLIISPDTTDMATSPPKLSVAVGAAHVTSI